MYVDVCIYLHIHAHCCFYILINLHSWSKVGQESWGLRPSRARVFFLFSHFVAATNLSLVPRVEHIPNYRDYRVCSVCILGNVSLVLGRHRMVGYLDP